MNNTKCLRCHVVYPPLAVWGRTALKQYSVRGGTVSVSRESGHELLRRNCGQRQPRVRVDRDRVTGTPGRGLLLKLMGGKGKVLEAVL